jgi:hypothetical protein
LNNSALIDKTVEITVAKMNNTTMPPNEAGGENVAAFMQVIYDKLSELNDKEN